MYKIFSKGVVALLTTIGVSGAQAEGRSSGMILFTGSVVATGYRVLAASQVDRTPSGLLTRTAGTGNQLVVDFSTPAVRPVPARIWLTAREKASGLWHRVTAGRGAAGTHVRYSGFEGGQLSGNSGTLIVSRPHSAEPTLAIVTVAYR